MVVVHPVRHVIVVRVYEHLQITVHGVVLGLMQVVVILGRVEQGLEVLRVVVVEGRMVNDLWVNGLIFVMLVVMMMEMLLLLLFRIVYQAV